MKKIFVTESASVLINLWSLVGFTSALLKLFFGELVKVEAIGVEEIIKIYPVSIVILSIKIYKE